MIAELIGVPLAKIEIGDKEIIYHMNSEVALLMSGEDTIGFAFYADLPQARLVFFSYFGIDENFRRERSAETFWGFIKTRLATNEQFRPCDGIVWEIEPFDDNVVNNILDRREIHGTQFINDREEDRILANVWRLLFFESGQAYLFSDQKSGIPLLYRSPCINRDLDIEHWQLGECEMWVMFYYLGEKRDLSPSATRALWSKSVHLLIDVIGLSQLTLQPGKAKEYFHYMNALYARIEQNNSSFTPIPKKYFETGARGAMLQRLRKLAPRHNRSGRGAVGLERPRPEAI